LLASVRADWIDRLTRLLTDEELRGRLGKAGRRSAEERYSLERHAPVMIATLERALARATRGRPVDAA
jgi:glycosyltransferase involved in cell wall biosynthesis